MGLELNIKSNLLCFGVLRLHFNYFHCENVIIISNALVHLQDNV